MNPEYLRPFFTYFGGKWRLSSLYPIPLEKKYLIEPFAGSAGYSLNYYQHKIILLDSDPVIYGIWHYLINVTEREILNLPIDIFDVDVLSIPQEAKWLIGFWLRKGVATPARTVNKSWYRYYKDTGACHVWSDAVKNRIVQQLKYIRHWKVYLGHYSRMPNRFATWFIDPPYQVSGTCYKCQVDNYDVLRSWILSREGRVIACEGEGQTWMPEMKHLTVTLGTTRFSREYVYTQDGIEI